MELDEEAAQANEKNQFPKKKNTVQKNWNAMFNLLKSDISECLASFIRL